MPSRPPPRPVESPPLQAETGQPRTERWTSPQGISLAVRGEGTPVFLMHGIGGNASSCGPLAAMLSAQGYRTLCWDAPGYGASADPAGKVDHSGVVLDVLAWLGIGPVHLIGTSWGGVIATRVAAQAPEAVRSIVLADSTRGSATTKEGAERMLARVPELAAAGPHALAARRAPNLVSQSAPPSIAEAVRAGMAAVRLPGYSAAATMMAESDTSALLPHLQVPALVLVGEDDVVTGVTESRILAQNIPGAAFEIIPGAGHAAIQEKPAEMSAAILAFWKRLK